MVLPTLSCEAAWSACPNECPNLCPWHTRQRYWIGDYTHEKKSYSLRKPILIMGCAGDASLVSPDSRQGCDLRWRGSGDTGMCKVRVDTGRAVLAPSVPK